MPVYGIRRHYDQTAWDPKGEANANRWQSGNTGYALVDAGIRELW